MNRLHPLPDKYDVKCDYDHIFGVKGTRWLRSLKLSDNDQILLHEYVMQIELTEIKNTESKRSYQASKNESVKILISMTGIDYLSAMLIASEIGDITRFGPPETSLLVWIMSINTPIRKFSLHGKNERWKQEGKIA